jgi:hypothetical protein
MSNIIYRCPTTGLNVQGWFADDPASANVGDSARANADETYEAVLCTACTKLHLINPKTGRTLGDDRN